MAFALAIAIFLLTGVGYWLGHSNISGTECIYGYPGCSTAAATWALAIFALFSFAAAAEAVMWTSSLFNIEVDPRMGQAECTKRGSGHPPNLEVFVLDDQVLIGKRPIGYNPTTVRREYFVHHVGFTNLGRTALVDVTVNMHLDNDSKGVEIGLGNIVRDAETHVVIYVSREYKVQDPEVCWGNACQLGEAIDFYPGSPVVSEAVYGIPDQPTLPIADLYGDKK